MDDATLDFLNKFAGGGGFSAGPDGKVTQNLVSNPMGDSSSPSVNFGSVQYDPNGPEVGNPLDFYDQEGKYSHSGVSKDIGSLGGDLFKFAALAGGLAFGLPALQGATGAGAAAGAGAADLATLGVGLPTEVGGWSLSGMGAAGAGAAGAASAAGGGAGAATGGLLSNPLLKGALSVGGSLFGGAGGGGGLGGILSGIYDYNQQNKAANNMLDWMREQQAKIDAVYDPQGERAKFMWEEMSRKDAAAGRNSQYGPRTTDFLGKFGGEYAGHTSNLARGLAGNFSDAFNQKASAGSGLAAGAGNFLGGGLNSIVQNLSSALGSNTPNWATGTGQYAQFTNDDYGQFF